jgi:hypothetical protein
MKRACVIGIWPLFVRSRSSLFWTNAKMAASPLSEKLRSSFVSVAAWVASAFVIFADASARS